MTQYSYSSVLVWDSGTSHPALRATGQIFDPSDLATPLTPLDMAGVATTLITDSYGVLPPFNVENHGTVVWVSGTIKATLLATTSIVQSVEAAQSASQSAALEAGISADAAQAAQAAAQAAALPTTGFATGRVLTALSATPGNIGWVTPSGGGTSKGYLVLQPAENVPAGTVAGTAVFRVGGVTPPAPEAAMITSGATNTSHYGSPGVAALSMPSGVAVGDVVCIAVACQSSSMASLTVSGGFTQAFWDVSTSRAVGLFYYRVPDAAALAALPSSVNLTSPAGSSGRWAAVAFRTTGVNVTTPFMVKSAYAVGDTATVTSAAATAAAGAGLVLSITETNNSAGQPVSAIASRTASNGATVRPGIMFNGLDGSAGGTGVFVDWFPFTGTAVPGVTTTFNPISQGSVIGYTATLKVA